MSVDTKLSFPEEIFLPGTYTVDLLEVWHILSTDIYEVPPELKVMYTSSVYKHILLWTRLLK